MLNIHTLWTLAVAEMRSCRRLARTWIIFGIALTFCIGWYINNFESNLFPGPPSGWIHYQMSPSYTVAEMMSVFVATFSFGLIFLVFDVRARDVQNRTHEIVDSLPANNFEIILGRLIGILLLLFILILLFIGLVACYEAITELIGIPHRVGIQPLSLVTLLIWSIIPNLVFYGALVACLSALVRVRLLVAIIALGVLLGLFWIDSHIPVRFQESLSLFSGGALVPSDLAPVFVTPAIIGNKCAILFIAIALFLFAASVLPRTEPRRTVTTTLGVTALGFATIMFFGLIAAIHGTENRK